MPDQITLYSAKICPWAHRTELALKESKLPYKHFEIDLRNKPEWYAPKVNPVSKVPALTYGGPDVAPDAPSPASQKLAESAILLEFIADIAPEAELLPKDPVLRAKARFFADKITTKFNSEAYRPAFCFECIDYKNSALSGTEDLEAILGVIDFIQQLLPEEGYAIGKWSIADAAVTPFLARTEISLKNNIGKYEEGKGKAIWAKLETDPKYARFRKYFADVKARDSFKETFHPDVIKEEFSRVYATSRSNA